MAARPDAPPKRPCSFPELYAVPAKAIGIDEFSEVYAGAQRRAATNAKLVRKRLHYIRLVVRRALPEDAGYIAPVLCCIDRTGHRGANAWKSSHVFQGALAAPQWRTFVVVPREMLGIERAAVRIRCECKACSGGFRSELI